EPESEPKLEPQLKLKENIKIISKDITAGAVEYGNQEINRFLDLIKNSFHLQVLDDTIQTNRRYCYLALKKFSAPHLESIIAVAAQDEFWKTKITSFKDLYYKGVKIASKIKELPVITKIS
ncbi:MAG: hypothetical protein HYZ54_13700, partial [Ignavibacteriae bacterium]|nr:hypothetical protein [Ignavibacteriota bacterium]